MAFRRKSLIAILVLASSACSTMHFEITEPAHAEHGAPAYTQWHHSVILQLVEISPPVDMSERCPEGRWTRITTELSLPGALAHHVTSGLWAPWSVTYTCGH